MPQPWMPHCGVCEAIRLVSRVIGRPPSENQEQCTTRWWRTQVPQQNTPTGALKPLFQWASQVLSSSIAPQLHPMSPWHSNPPPYPPPAFFQSKLRNPFAQESPNTFEMWFCKRGHRSEKENNLLSINSSFKHVNQGELHLNLDWCVESCLQRVGKMGPNRLRHRSQHHLDASEIEGGFQVG